MDQTPTKVLPNHQGSAGIRRHRDWEGSVVSVSGSPSPHVIGLRRHFQPGRSQPLNVVGEVGYYLGESGSFSSGDPFQPEAVLFDAGKGEKLFHHRDSFGCHVITVQVMAIADVSAAHKNAVSTFLESLENVVRRYGGRAHHPNVTDVGRVLQPTDSRQVSPGISAPVAEKRQNFRFESCHIKHSLSYE